jgi:TetR/AcrR family transcriptional regulator, transcriptional repressor for nem operon
MAGVRQFDEREALARALDVFWDKGFGATSMLDLAKGTGVQRGSLYHAYGSKEAIFLRAFTRFSDEFLAGARSSLEHSDRLTAFFEFCIQSITSGDPSRGCLSTRTAVDAGLDTPQVQAAVRQLLDDLEEAVFDALADTPLSVEPRQAARLIVGMTRGLAVLERVYQDPDRLRETAHTLVVSLTPRH